MIEPGELTRVQRLRARRQAAGQCARCGKDNPRRPLTVCAPCATVQKKQGRRFRAAHPGYMAAYGRAVRSGVPRLPRPAGKPLPGVMSSRVREWIAAAEARRAALPGPAPSAVGRAAPVDAARDPQGASGPKSLCRRCVKMYTGASCPRH